jgi:hypothetical protein
MIRKSSQSVPFESADTECRRLREENARLRQLLAEHNIPVPPTEAVIGPGVNPIEVLSLDERRERARKRVALFRSLFRGREDAYARRWESPDGRSGYSPAAQKDWKAISRSRPEDRKKVDQRTRKYFPLTDSVIESHLLGKEIIGVYPLLPDETCWFLAVDFDKKTSQEDSIAFMDTCRELTVPAALERSRPGRGGHVWIFFEHAVPAITARKLGCAILTRTMERRHQLGLDSYDRFFPSQDTMPKGGFGNLIALPLQAVPRKAANSVFVDANFQPYADQWAFLATLERVPLMVAEEIVGEAQRRGDLIGVRASVTDDEDRQDPWTLPPFRNRLERPRSNFILPA